MEGRLAQTVEVVRRVRKTGVLAGSTLREFQRESFSPFLSYYLLMTLSFESFSENQSQDARHVVSSEWGESVCLAGSRENQVK